MKKIKIGDIFEIDTAVGVAYLHYIFKDPAKGELIRVLQGVYTNRLIDLEGIAASNERYMVYFPLAAATRRKIVEHVGFYPALNFSKPGLMRTKFTVRGEFLGWHIVDTDTLKRELVKTLTPEQKKLSPWGIWNDTLLVENIVNGWSLDKW